MLIKRSKLEDELKIVLKYVNAKRNLKSKVIDGFKSHGFMSGEASAIISGTNPLLQLADEILYLLVWISYFLLDDEELKARIDPTKILTEKEIGIVKNLKVDRKSDNIYPIVFNNIHKDVADDYSGIIMLSELSELFDNRVIKYNPETQRPLVSKLYCGEEIKEIYLNKKNLKEIKQRILDGKQIADEIIFNVAATGEEEFEHNETTRELKVLSGDVFCISGWHRITSGRDAFKTNPSKCSQFYYKLRIVHWEAEKARAYVFQEASGTKFNILEHKEYDVSSEVHQVVSRLNENPKSNFRGKITVDNDGLINFNTMFNIISHLFKIEDNKDVVVISNYIRDGLNLITDENTDLLNKTIDEKLIIAYMVLLHDLYKSEDWQEQLLFRINTIKVSELEEMPYKKVNKRFIDKITEYVRSKEV